jgi:hypothetical protein
LGPEFVIGAGVRPLVLVFAFIALAACGASGAREPGASGATNGAGAADGGDGGSDGGAADAAPPKPAAKPFAGSPSEATQLIGTAIDQNSNDVKKCVAEYRARKKMPHERVEISVGIDQEGRLLGAALKGRKLDPTLSECVQRALASAPFPRSHAGVIQVTKSYEEIEQ